MSKRMHIYAAAIDPLRKKFGVSAREVAGIVTTTMSRNESLAEEVRQLKEEKANLESTLRVANSYREAMETELRTAREQIGQLFNERAAAAEAASHAPTAVEFMRFSPPRPRDGNIVNAHSVEPAELLETVPLIKDWLEHVLAHCIVGSVYDGGDFVICSIRTLAEQMGKQPPVVMPDADAA